jgi:hypothetical protein
VDSGIRVGKPLYQKMGFVSEYEIERWTLRRTIADTAVVDGPSWYETLARALPESVVGTDHEAFGVDRSFLLESLHHNAPEFTIEIRNDDALQGYTLGRRGLFADHLGPWMAKSGSAARHLLEAFLARSMRETFVVNCLKANNVAVTLLRSCGFTYSHSLTRMYRGPNTYPGRPDMLCAILGPEFG